MNGVSKEKETTLLVCVGVGSSAGGLKPLKEFFSHCQPNGRAVYFTAQHLNPHHQTTLPEILQKVTQLKVELATRDLRPEADHVYILPPGCNMELQDGVLKLPEREPRPTLHMPIDFLFNSLAQECGDRAVGVILSGAGSDGAMGFRQIKEQGGLILTQDPHDAEYDSMPRSAIATGLVDYILPTNEIPARIDDYADMLANPSQRLDQRVDLEQAEAYLKDFVDLLRDRTGHSFHGYKKQTLLRRIERRMQIVGTGDIGGYLDLVREDERELELLLRNLLIGVTQFFRDEEVFRHLREEVIPRMIREAKPNTHLRLWVPACASGEEVYSLAFCFFDAMEEMQCHVPLKIFATDIDKQALERARQGVYDESTCATVPARYRDKYFQKHEDGYIVSKDIRGCCVFSLHNLVMDPPFSRIDLVSCRNLLIYLNSDMQEQLIDRFHFALKQNGYLLLGPSESVGETNLFRAMDQSYRLYQSRQVARRLRPRYTSLKDMANRLESLQYPSRRTSDPFRDSVERVILDHLAPVCIIINRDGEICYYSRGTGPYLAPSRGEPSNNLITMIRSELRLELRTAIHKANADGEAQRCRNLSLKVEGKEQVVDIEVRPLPEMIEDDYTAVIFHAREAAAGETSGHPDHNRDLQTQQNLEEELANTKDYLQATVEELECSNEELTSSNQELVSLNEELQSANEELQTSREELQSTNEELVTANAELQSSIRDLDQAKNDLENLISSTEIATIFLDDKLRIKFFTPTAMHIFRLIESDLGRPLLDISSHLSMSKVFEAISEVLESHQIQEIEAIHEVTHQTFLVRISPYRAISGKYLGVTLSFIDVSDLKLARASAEMRESFESMLSDVALMALREEDFQAVLDFACKATAELVRGDMAKVLQYREEESDFILRAQWNLDYAKVGETTEPTDRESQAGYTFLQDAPVVVQNFDEETRFKRPEMLRDHDAMSGISVIIPGEKGPWGVFGIHVKSPRVWHQEVTEYIQSVAQTIAFALSSKRHRDEIARSEDRFSNMAATVPAILMIGDRDGKLTYVNPMLSRITGMKSADAMGMGWLEIIAPEDRDQVRQLLYDSGSHPQERTLTYRILNREGEARWFHHTYVPFLDQQGEPISWFGTVVDIHDLKMAEEARHESETRFRQLADAMPQMVWTTKPNGECDFLNRNWVEYTGVPVEKHLGHGWPEALHPDHRELARKKFTQAVRTGRSYEVEYLMKRHDGQYRWHLARGVPIKNESGEIIHWFGTNTDIEMLKQAQQSLNEAAQRKDQFLAMLGHELRNPLAAIRNCSHILNRPDAKPEHVRDSYEIIDRQGAHLSRLVDDLLDLSRISSGRIELRLETIDLREIIRHVANDFEPFLEEKKLEIVLDLPDTPLTCQADDTRLAQCFGNILHNAYKFSPEGAKIEVTLERSDDDKAICSFRDHGLGMDRFQLQRVFNPYESYHESATKRTGLGLGLSVVRGLVELHGGTVVADSSGKGEGSVFTITLPLMPTNHAASTTAKLALKKEAKRQGDIQRPKILLVEDDVNAARSIEMFFELEGSDVTIANSGDAALEHLKEEKPGIILCDICLPDETGFELVKKFREQANGQDVRIVAMSGLSRPTDKEKALESGFDAFIVKPPKPEELMAACYPERDG